MNFNSLFQTIAKLLSSPEVAKTVKYCAGAATKGGHHRKAVADGLRRGSSEAAKVMAKWRWK
jgi:hypothetical protein